MTFSGCVQGLPAHFLLKTGAKSCSALLFAVVLNAQKIKPSKRLVEQAQY